MVLLVAGMALGNTILVYIALVPFFFVVFSLAYPQPGVTRVERSCKDMIVYVNQAVSVSTELYTDAGTGIVTAADALPEHFELADGNNFHVFWNDGKSQRLPWSYQVRCTRRGTYEMGPAHVACFQASWLGHTAFVTAEQALRLMVRPVRLNVRKMRDPRLQSSLPMPSGAASRLGMTTTDFLEIRHYSHGDAFRAINWKATARLSTAVDPAPYVNEFEKEGRKTVFLFVDAGPWMNMGSTIDNVFEYAVQAASGIASFYLQRDIRVGVYVYHQGEFVLPDAGRRQASRIAGSLAEIQIDQEPGNADGEDSLRRAVRECSGHMAGLNPQFIVITMIGRDNAREIVEGIRSMRRYTYKARTPGITVLHVAGYRVAASDEAEMAGAALLEAADAPRIRAIRRAGAEVVAWNPRAKSLSQVLISGFRRRGA